MEREALVVGAGVIGLTSAIALAEAGWRVRIRTAAMPQETTSRAAGAMWGSTFAGPEQEVRRWAEASLHDLRALTGDPATGVRIARGMLAARSGIEGPPPGIFPGVQVTRRLDVPAGYAAAFGVDVPLIDMPVHLDYLLARYGGEVEVARVESLRDLDGAAPLVVNCTGIGARDLVPDPSLRAIRGQHVVVENPGVEEFFMEEPAPVWASWMPHGDRVVLGGSADEDDWRPAPDLGIAEAIVARCAAVEPRFAGARVVEHRVGLRPYRPEVRVERDGDVIHNYGHGGTGVGLAWGCAHEVVALAG